MVLRMMSAFLFGAADTQQEISMPQNKNTTAVPGENPLTDVTQNEHTSLLHSETDAQIATA